MGRLSIRQAKLGSPKFAGFTIIELMLVVAVISILLLVAIPAYQSYAVRPKVAEGLLVANPVLKAYAEYYHSNETFPQDNAEAGVAPANSFRTQYVLSVEVTDGPPAITITYDSSELSGIDVGSNTIVYTPTTDAARTVHWSCVGGTMPRWARPPRCRS